ncbi:formate dehydrogenase major subunit [Desulfofustis glycolicus DSM 9705]|uniref:Formate dehydrogenase major subunit n=1 Tax=Desulfofustis glycolicus DSM 9705 TaxID=1121409 RepID=A0A1M5TK96_9BACT|nr:formate dehydrogenase major subunit [Desulfofustis glycolicus DSM 9705]
MAGLAAKFGSGAMTNSVAEISDNKALLVIGSNTTENHPIIGLRMKEAVRNGAQLIVADPRRIPLVKFATLWLRHMPGTDSVLLNALMHVIIREGWEDRTFIEKRTEGFDAFAEGLKQFTPEFAENITGVPADDIVSAARIYATAENAGIYYAMGITQHSFGTNNVHAVGNLAMVTGNLGKHGAGVNPLRGQNNVQGCCDVGCLPTDLPGYQKVADAKVREKFGKAWGRTLSSEPGLTASEMTEKMLAGTLKGLYIFGENPALSDPNMNHSIKAFENLDLLVVQDIFLTETAELADVVLPSASFAEKEGTFTNSERRVQRVRIALDPPGQAQSDLAIIKQVYRRIDPEGVSENATAESVFNELTALWPAMAGMSYERLETEGLQWPCPTDDHPGTPYLHRESFAREGGKALFTVVPHVLSKELPDEQYPFVLTTGRQLFHYHTGTMTRRSTGLDKISPAPYIELNPEDAASLGIEDTGLLTVTSRRGSIRLKARVSGIVPPRVVFIPFHYKEAAANRLTIDAMDPISKIMEAKVCAVRLEK